MNDPLHHPEPAPVEAALRRPFRVRLPGFIGDKEIGLGDIVSRITYAVGLAPCGGCRERRERLNRRMTFTR